MSGLSLGTGHVPDVSFQLLFPVTPFDVAMPPSKVKL